MPAFYCFGVKVTPPEVSIHPRVQKGRTMYGKVNTARPSARTTKMEKNLQRRQQAYKPDPSTHKPGSLKK